MKILLLSGLLIAGLACSAQAEGDPAKGKRYSKNVLRAMRLRKVRKKLVPRCSVFGSGPSVRLKVSNTPNPWPRPDTPGTRNIL